MMSASTSSVSKVVTSYAPDVWKGLNGVFCAYKPKDLHMIHLKKTIAINLCRDLNGMNVRPPFNYVKIEGSSSKSGTLVVTNVPNLSDTPEVLGPRYQHHDFKIFTVPRMTDFSSGVCLVGINKGHITLNELKKSKPLRKYEVCGTFGMATTKSLEGSNVIERCTYDHIQRSHIDRLLSSWQAKHQRQTFQVAGVNLQSEEAYKLAAGGLVRPADDYTTVVYGIKCTELKLPDFKLEILSINENQGYFADLVHEMGWHLKSAAVCKKVRLIQYGKFPVSLALLRKHWTVQNILDNISTCAPLLSESLETSSPNL